VAGRSRHGPFGIRENGSGALVETGEADRLAGALAGVRRTTAAGLTDLSLGRTGQAVASSADFAGWRIRIALPKGSRRPMSMP
jgi:hypothetical protein